MRIVGLTGSIAMGKSTTAAMLRRLGVPVYDADAAVHRLTAAGGRAVAAIAARFPGVLDPAGAVDRRLLGPKVFGKPQELKALEAILHPLVREEERRFLARCRRERRRLAVLDIPLLFETRGETRCDRVWVVSASRVIQTQRALRRPGMNPDRLAAIRTRQIADPVKRRRADGVICSGLGRRFARDAVIRALARAKTRKTHDA
jgi:dephospho-CoA kinase